jgi:uncharacterized protein (DUF169 family)
MRKWGDIVRKMELLLRLKTFPVAFKLLEDTKEIEGNKWIRRPTKRLTLCQLITIVRTYDWTIGATADDFLGPGCGRIIGLAEAPDYIKDGTLRSIVWCKTKEDAKRCEEQIPCVPAGKYNAVLMGPLVYNPFDPDIVLIYGNPAQMIILINALQFEDYEQFQFFCVGESACADSIARCYLNKKPSLAIPCYGERRYAHVQDDELVMALPASWMEKAITGLEELYKRGVRYPISYYGAQVDPTAGFPPSYQVLFDSEEEDSGFKRFDK